MSKFLLAIPHHLHKQTAPGERERLTPSGVTLYKVGRAVTPNFRHGFFGFLHLFTAVSQSVIQAVGYTLGLGHRNVLATLTFPSA